MPDGNLHAPVGKQPGELGEQGSLRLRPGQIPAVGGGEVAEKPLGIKPGQPGNPGAEVGVVRGDLKADTAHAGVHREVEPGGFPPAGRPPDKRLRIREAEDGGADFLRNRRGKGGRGCIAQNQNGRADSGLPQFQRLQHGGNAEKRALIPQQPRNFHSAVAVGIRFNHGHHIHAGLFADRMDIGQKWHRDQFGT